MDEKVKNICNNLLNIRYKCWFLEDNIDENPPFYYNYDKSKLEYLSKSFLQENGINCAGFINLVCLFSNKKHPLKGGGTDGWFSCLKDQNKLHEIDINKAYPFGTLLLRNYSNEKDQGHLAIKYDNKVLENSKIIHCYSNNFLIRELSEPGVVIEDFKISNMWNNPTYTHISFIEDWFNL